MHQQSNMEEEEIERLTVVTGSVTSELEDFSCEVFENGSQVDGTTNSLSKAKVEKFGPWLRCRSKGEKKA